MCASRAADQVDPRIIHGSGILSPGKRVFQIGDDKIRSAGFHPPVRSAEIRDKHMPVSFRRQNGIAFHRRLRIISAPGMQPDHQRAGLGGAGTEKHRLLKRRVEFAGIINLTHRNHFHHLSFPLTSCPGRSGSTWFFHWPTDFRNPLWRMDLSRLRFRRPYVRLRKGC